MPRYPGGQHRTALCFASPAQPPLLDQRVDRRNHCQREHRRRDHPTNHRRRDAAHHVRAGAGSPRVVPGAAFTTASISLASLSISSGSLPNTLMPIGLLPGRSSCWRVRPCPLPRPIRQHHTSHQGSWMRREARPKLPLAICSRVTRASERICQILTYGFALFIA